MWRLEKYSQLRLRIKLFMCLNKLINFEYSVSLHIHVYLITSITQCNKKNDNPMWCEQDCVVVRVTPPILGPVTSCAMGIVNKKVRLLSSCVSMFCKWPDVKQWTVWFFKMARSTLHYSGISPPCRTCRRIHLFRFVRKFLESTFQRIFKILTTFQFNNCLQDNAKGHGNEHSVHVQCSVFIHSVQWLWLTVHQYVRCIQLMVIFAKGKHFEEWILCIKSEVCICWSLLQFIFNK